MANETSTATSSDIRTKWPCRDTVIEQLVALLDSATPSPPTLVIHGPHATGKTSIVKAIAKVCESPYAHISCDECITERHLLERIVAATFSKLQTTTNGHVKAVRCETVNALVTLIEPVIAAKRFVLVLDGIDKQREASPFMISALARLAETLPSLVTVLIVSDPPPRSIRRPGIPHIHFESYTREQSLHIVSQHPMDIFDLEHTSSSKYNAAAHEEDKAWLWPRFCAAVWDSLGVGAARDLESFRSLCERLWQPFIQPILQGELGTRNISRLMVAQRRLFQDETVLIARLVPDDSQDDNRKPIISKLHELPYYAKWLLLAGFLASTNPSRLDAVYFMKSTDKKKRKKGDAAGRSTNKQAQQRRIPRHLLAPSPFSLDRLLSILHAILPDTLRSNIDIYSNIATLTSLRLLSKGSGLAFSDALEPGTKWRVGPAVTWDFITRMAASVEFELTDYIAE